MAISKNKHDIMLHYNQVRILEAENKIDSALCLMNDITTKYPNKSFYSYKMYKMMYNRGMIKEAIPYIIQTIILSPRIIESTHWEEIVNNDPETAKQIVERLKKDLESKEISNYDIIQLTKYNSPFTIYPLLCS